MPTPRTPDHARLSFARTNRHTIMQRVRLLRELAPNVLSIAEVCGGDCAAQAAAYRTELGIGRFLAVDIDPKIVDANRQAGVSTVCADALDASAMRVLLDSDVVFFGPPLSEECDGHRLLAFSTVRPSFQAFAALLLSDLHFDGIFVCIAPRTTTMGDARKLHAAIQTVRPDYGLSVIHHSLSSLTGRGESTEPRRKYVELWFTRTLGDSWTIRESID